MKGLQTVRLVVVVQKFRLLVLVEHLVVLGDQVGPIRVVLIVIDVEVVVVVDVLLRFLFQALN